LGRKKYGSTAYVSSNEVPEKAIQPLKDIADVKVNPKNAHPTETSCSRR